MSRPDNFFEQTEKILYSYHARKARMAIIQENQRRGFTTVAEIARNHDKWEDLKFWIFTVDIAIDAFSDDERMLFEGLYKRKLPRQMLWDEMSINKNQFYSLRRELIEKTYDMLQDYMEQLEAFD